jgi:hypothetical protein
MPKEYPYVGPDEIRKRSVGAPPGMRITKASDLEAWVRTNGPKQTGGLIGITFVVDEEGFLRIADRHTEHVACAAGNAVLSAGELFLRVHDKSLCVEEASNQSTGYCPEPESWTEVERILEHIGVTHPGRFTTEIVFRLCPSCGERNIVKDFWFVCAICESELPASWNF